MSDSSREDSDLELGAESNEEQMWYPTFECGSDEIIPDKLKTDRETIRRKLAPNNTFEDLEDLQSVLSQLPGLFEIFTKHMATKMDCDHPCKYRRLELRCKFGIRVRSKKRHRCNQKYYGMFGCSSKIIIRYSKELNMLKVVFSDFRHLNEANRAHSTHPNVLRHIPELRRLTSSEKEYIKETKDLGVKSFKIAQRLRAKARELGVNKAIYPKDIKNFTDRLNEIPTITEIDRVLTHLKSCEDKGATVKYKVTDGSNELSHIFYQSVKMRQSFEIFSNVLLLDGTYRLSNSGFVVYVWVAIDNHMKGRIVGWSMVKDETDETVRDVIQTFQLSNNTQFTKTKTLMIDKSFQLLAEIHKAAESAGNCNLTVLICKVHTWRNFQAMVHSMSWTDTELSEIVCEKKTEDLKNSTGRQTASQTKGSMKSVLSNIKKNTKNRLWQLLTTRDESHFFSVYNEMIQDHNTPAKWRDDFIANWGDCMGMWALCFRSKAEALFTDDNNRIESLNQKLKQCFTTLYTSLDKCIVGLLSFEERHFESAQKTDFDSTLRLPIDASSNDATIRKLYTCCSETIATLLKKQYRDIANLIVTANSDTNSFTVQCTENVTYSIDDGQCSCEFSIQMDLPCKHIMAVNVETGREPLEGWTIPNRWTSCPETHYTKVSMQVDKTDITHTSQESTVQNVQQIRNSTESEPIPTHLPESVTLDHRPIDGKSTGDNSTETMLETMSDSILARESTFFSAVASNSTQVGVIAQEDLSVQQRLNKVVTLSKQIATFLSVKEQREFDQKYQTLSCIFESWRTSRTDQHVSSSNAQVIVLPPRKKVAGKPKTSTQNQPPDKKKIKKRKIDKMIAEVSDEGTYLSEDTMCYAISLLKKRFPTVAGNEKVSLSDRASFGRWMGKYVQVVSLPENLYVCMYGNGTVGETHIYSSFTLNLLQSPELLKNTKHIDSQSWRLVMNGCKLSTQQVGLNAESKLIFQDICSAVKADSGVMALAVATELCRSGDPVKRVFKQGACRKHVGGCIKKNSVTQFPSSKKVQMERPVIITVPIYCSCRLPGYSVSDGGYDSGTMTQCLSCEVWFHNSCVDGLVKDQSAFICGICKLNQSTNEHAKSVPFDNTGAMQGALAANCPSSNKMSTSMSISTTQETIMAVEASELHERTEILGSYVCKPVDIQNRYVDLMERKSKSTKPVIRLSVTEKVSPNVLVQYTEVDRAKYGKYSGHVETVKNSIQEFGGIHTPLILSINKQQSTQHPIGSAYLHEGNTRVAVALDLGMRWIPLKIIYTFMPRPDTSTELVPVVPIDFPPYPSPSDFGFVVRENMPELPDWGGSGTDECGNHCKMTNTCTIDNILGILSAHYDMVDEQLVDFLTKAIISDKERMSLEILRQSLHLISVGLSFEGKLHFLHRDRTYTTDHHHNTFGSEFAHFLSHINWLFETQEVYKCLTDKCNVAEQAYDGRSFMAVENNAAVEDSRLQKSIRVWHTKKLARKQKMCPMCKNELQYTRRVWKYGVAPFLTLLVAEFRIQARNFPRKIHVLGNEYQLVGFTFHSRERGHFLAGIQLNDNWYKYDGLKVNDDQIVPCPVESMDIPCTAIFVKSQNQDPVEELLQSTDNF